MNPTALDSIAAQLAARKAALDAEFAPKVRNHLVQLYRKAHEVDPKLTGAVVGMGIASPTGLYVRADQTDSKTAEASDWEPGDLSCMKARHEATNEWLAELRTYSQNHLCANDGHDLPYIADITPADLVTERVKRAKVWRRA